MGCWRLVLESAECGELRAKREKSGLGQHFERGIIHGRARKGYLDCFGKR